MKTRMAALTLIVTLAGCASQTGGMARHANDPYPGSGGMYDGATQQANGDLGLTAFKQNKARSFEVGVTTKRQVVDALGPPTHWRTYRDGTSELVYNLQQPGKSVYRPIKEIRYSFDKDLVLAKQVLPAYAY